MVIGWWGSFWNCGICKVFIHMGEWACASYGLREHCTCIDCTPPFGLHMACRFSVPRPMGGTSAGRGGGTCGAPPPLPLLPPKNMSNSPPSGAPYGACTSKGNCRTLYYGGGAPAPGPGVGPRLGGLARTQEYYLSEPTEPAQITRRSRTVRTTTLRVRRFLPRGRGPGAKNCARKVVVLTVLLLRVV